MSPFHKAIFFGGLTVVLVLSFLVAEIFRQRAGCGTYFDMADAPQIISGVATLVKPPRREMASEEEKIRFALSNVRLLQRAKGTKPALNDCLAACEKFPESLELQLEAGRLEHILGKNATGRWEKALRLDPLCVAAHQGLINSGISEAECFRHALSLAFLAPYDIQAKEIRRSLSGKAGDLLSLPADGGIADLPTETIIRKAWEAQRKNDKGEADKFFAQLFRKSRKQQL